MKTTKHIFLFIYFLWCSFLALGQSQKEKEALEKFDNYQYINAIETYEALVEKGLSSRVIFQKLGDANYLNGQYTEAAKWYKKLSELPNGINEPQYLYKYAQTLKSLEDYDASKRLMNLYLQQADTEQRAATFKSLEGVNFEIKNNEEYFQLKSFEHNSSYSDFSPTLWNETIVFSSSRDTGTVIKKIHEWNKNPFLNLYKVQKNSSSEELSEELNSFAHESSATFTKDGKTIYFTRNNVKDGRLVRDSAGINHLKIIRAEFIENKWTNFEELPFGGDSYSIANPALNPQENKLFFASNMPGTFGLSDIYVVTINADGSFGTPQNLGPDFNTEGRETFPFIDANNQLFFASDGRPGLGGLDIYVTKLESSKPMVQNLGTPINSSQDDFSIVINKLGTAGYFASNREGGKGGDDIYAFDLLKPFNLDCNLNVSGYTINIENGTLIQDVNLTIVNRDGSLIKSTATNSSGEFLESLSCNTTKRFIIRASKEGFEPTEKSFDLKDGLSIENLELELKPIPAPAEVGTDLAVLLQLNPIYFDTNKATIRPDAAEELNKVLAYMVDFPEVKIEIRSHTDSRGRDSYNLELSDRRAKSTGQYLIDNGIAPERITAEGFGEKKLLNRCANGVQCSKEEHELNRRSEFIIVQ
ncbi:OmpA family protein [Croceivirga lutea]|uniref:OmpA family protein n=1 Tax=Croceivirga lutea TaxID=1775167 RepID=UPI001639E492|nr:OmpA family protein [Croceivirga lutea]